jgi:hypothetical protein
VGGVVGWDHGIKPLKVNKGDRLCYQPPIFNLYTSKPQNLISLLKINFTSPIRRKRQRPDKRQRRYEKILVSRQSLDPVLEFF